MIKLAYCDVSDLNLADAYKILPKTRQKKVDRFRFEKDKKLSAGTYLLLINYLKKKISQIQF